MHGKIIIILVFSFLMPLCSFADSQTALLGRSPYAIMHPKFQCQAYQQSRDGIGNYGIAVLWNTFGHDYDCLNQELANPDLKLVEVHLINGPCIRNSNCGRYEVLYGYSVTSLNAAIERNDPTLIKKFQATSRKLANYLLPKLRDDQECYISPILESNVPAANMVSIIQWIEASFNNRCKFVWNPVGSSPGLPVEGSAVSEGHGFAPVFQNNQCIANPDGAVITDPSGWETFFSATSKCVTSLGWVLNDNCLSPQNSKFVDPRARSCEDVSGFPQVRAAIIAAQATAKAK